MLVLMYPVLGDPEIDYNEFDEGYSPKTPFDCSTLKNVCEAWNDDSKPISERKLDKFDSANFDTVVTYNTAFRQSFVNNIVKPILDDALSKHKCPPGIRDTIVGSVISKPVSLGTWDKKSGEQVIVGCPMGHTFCPWFHSLPSCYVDHLPISSTYQFGQQQRIWLMWDLSIKQILSPSTRSLQAKTGNYSMKKLFTNLDRHWDMCHCHFRKPCSLKGFLAGDFK